MQVDDLDVVRLKTVPVNLNKLSDVEDNEVVKNKNSAQRKQK